MSSPWDTEVGNKILTNKFPVAINFRNDYLCLQSLKKRISQRHPSLLTTTCIIFANKEQEHQPT